MAGRLLTLLIVALMVFFFVNVYLAETQAVDRVNTALNS